MRLFPPAAVKRDLPVPNTIPSDRLEDQPCPAAAELRLSRLGKFAGKDIPAAEVGRDLLK